ncbi:MAG: hypothetical protein LBG80_19070 [Bacteroidales bacterium]|nr:hypothetical protein [Bacteroidales bacterium]
MNRKNNADGNSSLLDSLTGGKEIPFSISLDMVTVSYLGVMVLVVGVILIIISKKIIK